MSDATDTTTSSTTAQRGWSSARRRLTFASSVLFLGGLVCFLVNQCLYTQRMPCDVPGPYCGRVQCQLDSGEVGVIIFVLAWLLLLLSLRPWNADLAPNTIATPRAAGVAATMRRVRYALAGTAIAIVALLFIIRHYDLPSSIAPLVFMTAFTLWLVAFFVVLVRSVREPGSHERPPRAYVGMTVFLGAGLSLIVTVTHPFEAVEKLGDLFSRSPSLHRIAEGMVSAELLLVIVLLVVAILACVRASRR